MAEQQRAFKGVWIPAEIWLNENLSLQEKYSPDIRSIIGVMMLITLLFINSSMVPPRCNVFQILIYRGDAGRCEPSASRFLEKSSAKTFNILGPFRVA